MSSISRPVRTYSRRQSTKGPSVSASPSPDRSGIFASVSPKLTADEEERPRKRRTLIDRDADSSGRQDPFSTPRASSSNRTPSSRLRDRSPKLRTAPSSPTRYSDVEVFHPHPNKGKGKATNGSLFDNSVQISAGFRIPSPSNDATDSNPTTPKKPKDLSRIFESVSPQRAHSIGDSIQASPGKSGITKKMLSRSKTESSIESSSPKASLELPPKAQSFVIPRESHPSDSRNASPSNSPKKQLSRNTSLGAIPPSAHAQKEGSTNTRTYAGKSRSFLVALPANTLLSRKGEPGVKQEDRLDEDDEDYLRDSYAELRKRYGVDNSEGLDAESGDTGSVGEGLALYNPLSSITDLRSKGESRRFRDEVGYLFEGLEPSGGLGVRRGSALDIISNLSDYEFWKKARAAGLITEIWDRLREAGAGNGDKVLDSILVCFVALASDEPRDISLLANNEDFIETSVRLMTTHGTNDPLRPSTSNSTFAKPEALTLTRLRDVMSAKTSIIPDECEPSSRLLLSRALSSAPSLAFPHLPVILESVIVDLDNACARLAAYRSGLELFNEESASDAGRGKLCFAHIHNCLTILDLYLIEIEAETSSEDCYFLSKAELRLRYRSLPSGIIALIVVSDVLSRNKSSGTLCAQALRCSELAFRILINLTNGDATWTDAVVADPYTLPTVIRVIESAHRSLLWSSSKKSAAEPSSRDTATSAMDRLCLALALLTNLLQERDNLAYSLQNMMLDPSCEGRGTCLLSCRCVNSISAISGLVNIYISFLKDEDDGLAPDFHFLRGHLAVLIGLLLLQLHSPGVPSSSPSPSAVLSPQSALHSILDPLPGPSDIAGLRHKLNSLIDDIETFAQLYASLTSRVTSGSSGSRTRSRNAADIGVRNEDSSVGNGLSDDSSIATHLRPDDACGAPAADSDVVAGVATSLRVLREELQ